MSKQLLINMAEQLGLQVVVNSSRPEMHVMSYDVVFLDRGEIIGRWDGGYFIGEENTANSKDSMFKDYKKRISELQLKDKTV